MQVLHFIIKGSLIKRFTRNFLPHSSNWKRDKAWCNGDVGGVAALLYWCGGGTDLTANSFHPDMSDKLDFKIWANLGQISFTFNFAAQFNDKSKDN